MCRQGKTTWCVNVSMEPFSCGSLDSGNLKWTRLAELTKEHVIRWVFEPSPHLNDSDLVVESRYRSVVFHPSKNVILPGNLSKCYTFNGDQKSLFLL